MRKHYLDNLRWAAVLLLFVYHTCMIYNSFESFYIKGPAVPALNGVLVALYPAYMPLLFVIAGISTAYALQKRSIGEFIKERVLRLLVPFLTGMLLLVPAQTYFAERFHNGYTGGYFAQYKRFFSLDRLPDLTGYNGGFTPGHLWFILYLFIISVLAAGLIALLKKPFSKLQAQKIGLPVILSLFLLHCVMALILDLGGKSLGEYFSLFMAGYLVLANDEAQQALERARWPLFTAYVVTCAANLLLNNRGLDHGTVYDIFVRLNGWLGVLGLLGLARRGFNQSNRAFAYVSRAAFPVYLFHQTALVAAAYYVFRLTGSTALQFVFIIVISAAVTFAAYEIARRFSATRFLFGIKK